MIIISRVSRKSGAQHWVWGWLARVAAMAGDGDGDSEADINGSRMRIKNETRLSIGLSSGAMHAAVPLR